MKKILLILSLLILPLLAFAEENAETQKDEPFLYIISKDEISYFFQSYNWLKQWESGEIKVSDKDFEALYEARMGHDSFTSMLFENFFRNTNNKDIHKQLEKYIQKKKLSDKPYEKALLKKIASKEQEYEQDGKKLVRYIYNDSEYDENINLFDINEVHPFDDEFGVLLLMNDYAVLRWKSRETDELTDDKEVILMCGGGTNSISIKIKEIENVTDGSKESIIKNTNLDFIANKYPDDWFFTEVDKIEVLENCGVDNYYIGYGLGSDLNIPEIAAGDFVACLYKKETGKIYYINTYMNFSKINISYEIKDWLYNYLMFFTLLCYCD